MFALAVRDRQAPERADLIDDDMMRAHSRQNLVQTVALMVGLAVLLAVPTGLVWGIMGLAVAAVLIVAMFLVARATPPEMIMRAYQGERVTDETGSGTQLVHIVSVLAERAGLPERPTLFVIPSLTLNAFATGSRSHAAVAITEGMLRKLSLKELAAVLAHEISHIKNNDLGVMALADIASRMVQGMSYAAVFLLAANIFSLFIDGEPKISWLAIAILYLAPLLSSLLQLALSRTREFDADLEAAELTGNPQWLASALMRLERHTGAFWEDLMLPVPGRRVPQPSLLRTHPTTQERVDRLAQLVPRPTLPPLLIREEPFVSMVGVGAIAMRPRYRFPGIWF